MARRASWLRLVPTTSDISAMDGVSVAATIVGLVGAAIQSTQSLIGTISSIKSVPGDVKDLRGELDSLTGVLQKVQKHLTSAPDSFEGSQDSFEGSQDVPLAVRNCQTACDDFSALLKRWLRHSADDKIFWTDRWRIGMFGEARIKSFRDRLATDKATLSLALQTDGLYVSWLWSKLFQAG
jgi:STAND-like protein